MKQNKILLLLSCVLAISSIILAVTLHSINKSGGQIPESAIDDIVTVLEADGILVDRGIISSKLERGTVYVSDSAEYNITVASLIGGSKIQSSYTVPDGEIIVLSTGERFEFYENFSFRYSSGEGSNLLGEFELSNANEIPNTGAFTHIGEIVKSFLDSGNRNAAEGTSAGILTEIEGVWELDGKHYALCSRTVGGIRMVGNSILCLVERGEVTQASGTWCFLTLGESYSAQLIDHINILFNVKKELDGIERDGNVRINSIESCYSLYFIDNYFCLIPCWQVETDTLGKFIYNAINGELSTRIN